MKAVVKSFNSFGSENIFIFVVLHTTHTAGVGWKGKLHSCLWEESSNEFSVLHTCLCTRWHDCDWNFLSRYLVCVLKLLVRWKWRKFKFMIRVMFVFTAFLTALSFRKLKIKFGFSKLKLVSVVAGWILFVSESFLERDCEAFGQNVVMKGLEVLKNCWIWKYWTWNMWWNPWAFSASFSHLRPNFAVL